VTGTSVLGNLAGDTKALVNGLTICSKDSFSRTHSMDRLSNVQGNLCVRVPTQCMQENRKKWQHPHTSLPGTSKDLGATVCGNVQSHCNPHVSHFPQG
jgi:hypothetical protein